MSSLVSRGIAACLIVIVGACPPGFAQPLSDYDSVASPAPPTQPPLTLREAIESTLNRNPGLEVFEFELQAQDARVRQAGLRPAPAVESTVENALGTGDTRSFDSAEITVALSQVIELGDKRKRRLAAATLGRDGVTIEQQAAQLDVLAETARRYIRVASLQSQLELTQSATALASSTVEAVSRRVEAGRSPDVELIRARAALTRAQIDERHAQHELSASRVKLAAMWGDTTGDFSSVLADLSALPNPMPFETLVERLKGNPDFLRFASEARRRDAEIRLAQSRRRSDIEVSAGVRQLQESNDQAFVFGITVPLFARRQGDPAVAEARALRNRIDIEERVAFIDARSQLLDLYQELLHAISATELLTKEVLPEIKRAYEQTEYAYERGRYSFLELIEGQRTYLETQRALIESTESAQSLQVEIERLTGEPLQLTSSTRTP